MEKLRINKVTLNIGVGGASEKLQKAEKLLQELTGQKPLRTYGKMSISEWNVKKAAPIGVKVTLRKKKATDFLARAFEAVEKQVKATQFDKKGNLSFGVKEYIELPGAKYDTDIGMFGMDVSVNLERPGFRISKRRISPKKLPNKIKITPEEAKKYFEAKFKIKVVTE